MRIGVLKIETNGLSLKENDIAVIQLVVYENNNNIKDIKLKEYLDFKESLLNNQMPFISFNKAISDEKYTNFSLYFEVEKQSDIEFLKKGYNHLINNKEKLEERLLEKEQLKVRVPKLIDFLNNAQLDFVLCVNSKFTLSFLEKYCNKETTLKTPVVDLQTLYMETNDFSKYSTFKRDNIVKEILGVEENILPNDFESKTLEKTFNDLYFALKLIKENELNYKNYFDVIFQNRNYLQEDLKILNKEIRTFNLSLNSGIKPIEKQVLKEEEKQKEPIVISQTQLEEIVKKVRKKLSNEI